MTTKNRIPTRMIAATFALVSATAGTASMLSATQPDPVRTSISSTGGRASTADVVAQRDRAIQMSMNGQFREAERQWARLAKMQRARGELPIEALRMRAQLSSVAGYHAKAASVMRQLADEASATGNADLSAHAYFEAAALYQQAGMHEKASVCMTRVNQLLQSSALDPEQRSSIEHRLAQG